MLSKLYIHYIVTVLCVNQKPTLLSLCEVLLEATQFPEELQQNTGNSTTQHQLSAIARLR